MDVKTDIAFSGNPVFNYKNTFTTSTQDGNLVQVNTKGQPNYTELNLSSDHYLTTTSKTLVALDENKLRIRSNTVELDYGNYTSPIIFYINDKIYVTTTDLQTKKVYLFDSQGKSIVNFPIYGSSSIVLDNIDHDRNLELIVKSEDDSMVVYEIEC